MNTSIDLSKVVPWKLWTGPEKFAEARKEAGKQGFSFSDSDPTIYDDRGFGAIYGERGNRLAYSGSDTQGFFRDEESTEIFLWSDGTIQIIPEIRLPSAESLAPGIKSLPTRRAWLQGRLAAVAEAVTALALNNENVPFDMARELDDLISEVRKLPKN